ncbi:hypothetical protein [Streptomyces sp. HPF1205]|uniref:hypothetical protein n=1 Tax=Streptomyces sp. HPF1205 TaxID=2873262 RepID=UPI0021F0AF67|nr:hypothetical protein [Streptomyces sp. HPF1205]
MGTKGGIRRTATAAGRATTGRAGRAATDRAASDRAATDRAAKSRKTRDRETRDRAGRRGPLAAFARFVICGGGVSLLSSGVLLVLTGRVPFAAANAAVTVASTALATELHHRFTFGAGKGLAGWRVHAQSALTLALAYAVTTTAVLALPAVRPHPSALLTQAVYLTASALTGTARFLVLRLLVFTDRPARPARPATPSPLTRTTITTAA